MSVTPSLMLAWRLEGRRVLVAGGGAVAGGRVALVLEAGAEVVLVAPELADDLRKLADSGRIEWRPRTLVEADLDGAAMVLLAIDDPDVTAQAVDWSRARGIPVNAADRPPLCDFWFPATFRDGPIQVAVSTNGRSPGAAGRIKRLLRGALPAEAAPAVERLGRWRTGLQQRVDSMAERFSQAGREARRPWTRAARLGESSESSARGRLTLVGAGPGDPGLLTVAALDALSAAELVIADALVPPAILALVDAEIRVARKQRGHADAGQAELDAWVREGLEAGRQVVRLKCGDPFVFGRGQEELESFRALGFEVDVVPGVTSAFAAPLAAGIPVTTRGLADRVTVITGKGQGGSHVDAPDFDAKTTLIWLMAVGELEALSRRLIDEHGFPEDWPVAVVERGSQPEQRAIRGSLQLIAALAREQQIQSPAAIVMGSVVRVAEAAAFVAEAVAAPETTNEARVA